MPPARDPRIRNRGFWGWVEGQVLRLQDDPDRRARAFRWAWFVSFAMVLLGFFVIFYGLFIAPAALAHPLADAAPAVDRYDVLLERPDGVEAWTATQTLHLAPGATGGADLHVWMPPDARNLVVAPTPANATFRYALEPGDVARLASDEPLSRVVIQLTLVERGGAIPDLVVPVDARAARVTLALPEGHAPPGGEWRRVDAPGAANAWALDLADAQAGARVVVTPAPPPPPGARELALQLAGLGALALAAGVAWTARRAPRLAPDESVGLLSHLRELQMRFVPVILSIVVLAFFFFVVGFRGASLYGLRVPVPFVTIDASASAIAFRVLAHQFTPEGVALVVLTPGAAALAQILMALLLAFAATFPLLAYQAAAFLGPALVAREKRFIARSVPVVVLLFLAGVAFAWVVMVPVTMQVLYSYAGAIGATPFLAVDALVGFSALLLLVFGATFELPVVMVALARLGVVSARSFASKWRHAVVGIFVFSALITPDGTGVTMVLLGLPLVLLYVVGIAAAKAAERRPA